jgi:hypothetical protein
MDRRVCTGPKSGKSKQYMYVATEEQDLAKL